MAKVPSDYTPMSELDLAHALYDGHQMAFGRAPSLNTLAAGWAQTSLETGRGKKARGNNVGNITAGSSWAGDHFELTVNERVKRDPDVWKTMVLKFRAYPSPAHGAADYWRLLGGTRYAPVLALFDAGDPRGAAEKLSALGYYTAPSAPYASSMASLFAEFLREYGGQFASPPPDEEGPARSVLTDEEIDEVARAAGDAAEAAAEEAVREALKGKREG